VLRRKLGQGGQGVMLAAARESVGQRTAIRVLSEAAAHLAALH